MHIPLVGGEQAPPSLVAAWPHVPAEQLSVVQTLSSSHEATLQQVPPTQWLELQSPSIPARQAFPFATLGTQCDMALQYALEMQSELAAHESAQAAPSHLL